MLPKATFQRSDGNTGAVAPSPVGNLAIIASTAKLPQNSLAGFTRPADAYAAAGLGPGTEYTAFFLQNAQNPAVLVSPSTSNAPTIYSQGQVRSGTSVGTWSGTPIDEYHPIVQIMSGTAVGAAFTYRYSLDGGQNYSGTLNGPVASPAVITLTAPNLGDNVGLQLSLAAGTLVAGDTYSAFTTRPTMNNSDLVAALEVLRVTKLPWENVLIDGDTSATMIGTIDSWLAGLEAVGVFKMCWTNTRHKNRPVPTTETEAQYAAAMATLVGTTSTLRVDVGADAAETASPLTGINQPRPTALFAATRAEKISIGTDPAWVDLGPLPGNPQIYDTSGNPTWHDENTYPGLDALRLTTLRLVPTQDGTFITNANLLSAPGSDYVFDQHARCMNVACTAAYSYLVRQFGRGVNTQPPDPVTQKVYITEASAALLEAGANRVVKKALGAEVTDVAVILARNDDLSSNAGATLNVELQLLAKRYIKGFAVVTKFVRSITVKVAA